MEAVEAEEALGAVEEEEVNELPIHSIDVFLTKYTNTVSSTRKNRSFRE
jgi:hypothetical protein